MMSRDMVRFLADVAAKPLSTTVSRYQRLSLSRRRGSQLEKIDPAATEMFLSHAERGMKKFYAQRDWARLHAAIEKLEPVLALPTPSSPVAEGEQAASTSTSSSVQPANTSPGNQPIREAA